VATREQVAHILRNKFTRSGVVGWFADEDENAAVALGSDGIGHSHGRRGLPTATRQ